MKIYSISKKRTLWFNRVDWLRVLIFFMVIFLLFFGFFHFVIGGPNMLEQAFVTSLFLAYIISLGLIITYVIENRINIYIEKEGKVYVLCPHKFSNEYENTAISYKLFKKVTSTKEEVEVIFKNIKDCQGIDLIEIKEIEKIRMNKKNFKFKAKVKSKEWTPKGGIFTIKDYVLETKNSTMNFIVSSDYENYKELYDKLSNYVID